MTPHITVALQPKRHKEGTSEKTQTSYRLKGRMDLGPLGFSVFLKPPLWSVTLVS